MSFDFGSLSLLRLPPPLPALLPLSSLLALASTMAAATVATTATDLVAYVNTLLELSVELPLESKKVDAGAAVAAVAPLAEQLLAHDAETDVEGAFRLLFDLVRVLPTAAAAHEARALLAVVLNKADEKAVLRLRMCVCLLPVVCVW